MVLMNSYYSSPRCLRAGLHHNHQREGADRGRETEAERDASGSRTEREITNAQDYFLDLTWRKLRGYGEHWETHSIAEGPDPRLLVRQADFHRLEVGGSHRQHLGLRCYTVLQRSDRGLTLMRLLKLAHSAAAS